MWSSFDSLLHPSKKGLSFPFSLSKKIIYLEIHLKGEFTDYCFTLKVTRVLPYSYTGKKVDQKMVNTLLMIKINHK